MALEVGRTPAVGRLRQSVPVFHVKPGERRSEAGFGRFNAVYREIWPIEEPLCCQQARHRDCLPGLFMYM